MPIHLRLMVVRPNTISVVMEFSRAVITCCCEPDSRAGGRILKRKGGKLWKLALKRRQSNPIVRSGPVPPLCLNIETIVETKDR